VAKQMDEILELHSPLNANERRARSIEMLKKVGIREAASRLDSYPHQLSGGQRQRVMIAMALANNPDLFIADEPTTALDVTVQAQVLELIAALSSRLQSAVLLITHNLGVVAELADRVIIMYAGQIVEEAGVVELFDRPAHPYTRGLMASVPRLDEEQDRLTSIPGSVPAPDAYPAGCRFSTRCAFVMPICRQQQPGLVDLGAGHRSRCFLHEADRAS
jgi:oligopeptide/dipeptide ABC transporter ATP-binding protein